MATHGKKLSAAKKARKKQKVSTSKRYDARKAKREEWEKKNPTMVAGKLGEVATLKPAMAVDEKKMEQAVEMQAAQAEARAAMEAP